MSFNLGAHKPKLTYPCKWIYKVIGFNQEGVRKAIFEVVGDGEYSIEHSNNSTNGKYCCLNFEMTVHSEENRTKIYESLKNHPNVKIVL